MVTKADERTLIKALQDLATHGTAGVPAPMTARLEAAIDSDTDAVLRAYAAVHGGRMARSKAARALLRKGAEALLAELEPRA